MSISGSLHLWLHILQDLSPHIPAVFNSKSHLPTLLASKTGFLGEI